jgi:hypothetical protein
VKSETPEGPRIIDAAERARLHERYIDKFTADALSLGLKPGSGKFMAFVVDWLEKFGFSSDELRALLLGARLRLRPEECARAGCG